MRLLLVVALAALCAGAVLFTSPTRSRQSPARSALLAESTFLHAMGSGEVGEACRSLSPAFERRLLSSAPAPGGANALRGMSCSSILRVGLLAALPPRESAALRGARVSERGVDGRRMGLSVTLDLDTGPRRVPAATTRLNGRWVVSCCDTLFRLAVAGVTRLTTYPALFRQLLLRGCSDRLSNLMCGCAVDSLERSLPFATYISEPVTARRVGEEADHRCAEAELRLKHSRREASLPRGGVRPRAYLAAACGAVLDIVSPSRLSKSRIRQLAAREDVRAESRDIYVLWAESIRAGLTSLDAAGVPRVPHGERIARTLIEAVSAMLGNMENAEREVNQFPAIPKAQVRRDLRRVGQQLAAAYNSFQANAVIGAELYSATRHVAVCRQLRRTISHNQHVTITGGPTGPLIFPDGS